jgi:hypothetical protein
MSTELVGPLPSVRFRGGPSVAYTPPKDTCDSRYKACVHHRVACDCREAEFAENLSEWRAERRMTENAINEVLRGHQTWAFNDDGRDEMAECRCTGCQIVRLARCGWRPLWQISKDRREAARSSRTIGGDE